MEALTLIWFRPREAVKTDPATDSVWLKFLLMWAWGAAYGLERTVTEGTMSQWSVGQRLGLIAIVGAFSGPLYFWMMTVAIDLTGSWFKARGTAPQIKRALIFGGFPRALSLMFYLLLALMFGEDAFNDADLLDERSLGDAIFYLLAVLAAVTLTVWSLIATAKALAEVQGFGSAWKAWLHQIVAFTCTVLLLAIPLVVWIWLMRAGKA